MVSVEFFSDLILPTALSL